ncbi:MAG: acetate/propionate family kinase [Verrucomicrobia bacterium]|nr:acetate/propionate family kinase [Verrucomicrobiota bacterium]
MTNILVVNSGSSSLKLTLFQFVQGKHHLLFEANLKGMKIAEGLGLALEKLGSSSLAGIGHRVVHGGDRYRSSTPITKEVLRDIQELTHLAPLHNAACLEGIMACYSFFGEEIPQVAVFDTAFHSSLPDVASHYAISKEITEKHKIKRYGFHGISHAFLWNTYAQAQAKIITMHLGAGCSMCAIRDGVSIDTSMGFTPAEGLVMATRAGDVDAALVEFLALHEKKSASEIMKLLNGHSGLLGLSGVSADMQQVVSVYEKNASARLAVDLFCYRIVKYIGAYLAVLQGAEALIFSGGIGENAVSIRSKIIDKMAWYGVKMDEKANACAVGMFGGEIRKISAADSSVAVYVVATEENLFIAREVLRLNDKKRPKRQTTQTTKKT